MYAFELKWLSSVTMDDIFHRLPVQAITVQWVPRAYKFQERKPKQKMYKAYYKYLRSMFAQWKYHSLSGNENLVGYACLPWSINNFQSAKKKFCTSEVIFIKYIATFWNHTAYSVTTKKLHQSLVHVVGVFYSLLIAMANRSISS